MNEPLEDLNLSLFKESMIWKTALSVVCDAYNVNQKEFFEGIEKIRDDLETKKGSDYAEFLNRSISNMLREINNA